MGTRFEFKTQEAMDLRVHYIFEELSFQHWRHNRGEDTSAQWGVLLEKLGILFDYLASSLDPRGMAMRTWCVLYAVRPDLIDNETIDVAAERFGVSQQRLCELLRHMRERTGITYRCKVGVSSTQEKNRARAEAMHRAKAAKRAQRLALEVAR